jgi:hypothetical protein
LIIAVGDMVNADDGDVEQMAGGVSANGLDEVARSANVNGGCPSRV